MFMRIKTALLVLAFGGLLFAATMGGVQRSVAGAVASPYVSSISGDTYSASGVSNGVVAESCGAAYNGGRAVNDTTDTYSWVIVGGNFGSSVGSVTLAGRAARISSWSSTKIVAYPSAPYNSGPMSTTLAIKTSNGTVNYPVSIVPAIKSRVFGQCARWVAYMRMTLGLQPSPTAYGGYSPFTATYGPRVGDQLQWNGTHTAIIVAVNTYYSGGWSRYNVQVSEQNYDCKNSTRTFWDYFEVNASKQITHNITHPSLGKATSYYR